MSGKVTDARQGLQVLKRLFRFSCCDLAACPANSCSIFPRVAQRDAHSSEMALQVHSTLALFSGEGSVIPGPYESRRVMKDVLKPKCLRATSSCAPLTTPY